MLRLFLLGSLIYGMVIGLRDGWLVIKWSRFFHSIGFTKVDPNKPMNWPDLIMNNVHLVTATPDAEQTMAYIARVSNPKNQDNQDFTKLLKYCIRNTFRWHLERM